MCDDDHLNGPPPHGYGGPIARRLRPGVPRPSALAPLRQPDFRRLSGAYLVNEAGNWLADVVLAVVVFRASHSPLATALLLLVTRGLPALLAPALVVRLSAVSLRRLLPALYGAEAVVVGVLALSIDNLSWPAIVAIAAVDGVVAVAARAVSRAAVTTLLAPSGLLAEGNGLMNIAFTAAGTIGPPAAGLLYATVGAGLTLGVDAATFFVAAVVLAGLSNRALVPDEDVRHWRERLSEGLAFVAGHALARRTLGLQALALVFMTAVVPVEVVFATSTLHAGSGGYGALVAAWGLGMPVGAVLFSHYGRHRLGPALLLATVAVGLSYLLTAAATSIVAACAFAVLGGVANAVQWVAFITGLQGLADDRHQPALAGLIETVGSLAPALGFGLGGVVAAALGARAAYAMAGAGVLVAAAALALARRRAAVVPAAPAAVADAVAARPAST
jgi:predicted MFS family arabinose efflux permease